eukprot:sb/3470980/
MKLPHHASNIRGDFISSSPHIISVYSCDESQFQCRESSRCLDKTKLCNGLNDCGGEDYSDETNCDRSLISSIFHLLLLNILVMKLPHHPSNIRGDFISSSPHIISVYSCDESQFQCRESSRCLDKTKLCNGLNDCGGEDYSDETNCVNLNAQGCMEKIGRSQKEVEVVHDSQKLSSENFNSALLHLTTISACL